MGLESKTWVLFTCIYFFDGCGCGRWAGHGLLTFCEYGGFTGFERGVGDGKNELVAWLKGWDGHYFRSLYS